MQHSFDTIYLDASAESWEQSGESARPGASFGDLLNIYSGQQQHSVSQADTPAGFSKVELGSKPK